MSSVLFLVWALAPHLIFSYNIDTSNPIIYENPLPQAVNNSFGFSVALSWKNNSRPASSLFVGAPDISSLGEGKVYRCTENGNERRNPCKALIVDQSSSPQEVNVRSSTVVLITGKSRGLGTSMAIGESAGLTVCAPYTLINSRNSANISQEFLHDMRGYCYDVPDALGNKLYRDNDVLMTELRYPNNKLINTMYGFSVNYAVNKGSQTVDQFIGQPRLDKVAIKQEHLIKPMLHELDEMSNLGYSITSGYYFNKNHLVLAAGAPGWMRTGKVFIYQSPFYQTGAIKGTVLGEYFGASLATGDFNGDGLQDLFVGAPHWGEVNFGRVYTFYGRTDGIFTPGLRLQGTAGYGQFGYTLASADLDRDGNSDLVVSAPWEESGVVYIYYGSSDFKSEISSVPITQKIESSIFMPQYKVERFGFALSNPVDIDENGYPDLAIGAYKSGHAVVLRSRPVIRTEVALFSNPALLQTSTLSFVVSVCVTYRGVNAPDTQELEFNMTVDEDHERIKDGITKIFSDSFPRDRVHCTNVTITFTKSNQNVYDPVWIRVQHRTKDRGSIGTFCSSCPVLHSEDLMQIYRKKVPFDTGCDKGTCNAVLSVRASFGGTRDNNEWVLGSKDISLNLAVSNGGDPAYQTEIIIDIPNGIHVGKSLPFCEEKKTGNNVTTLICEIGNPLVKEKPKNFMVELDMSEITESVAGTVLAFNITKRTAHVDLGTGNKTLTLHLKIRSEAYVTITGLANEESHDYSRTENKSMVPIRHTYQVRKFGETPIWRAYLNIDVPVRETGKNDFLTFDQNQFLTGSAGEPFTCSVDEEGHEIEDSTPQPESDYSLLLKRRRRGVSGYGEPTEETTKVLSTVVGSSETPGVFDYQGSTEETYISSTSITEADSNEGGMTIVDKTTDRTINLNCSMKNIECAKIRCLFSIRKTSGDWVTIVLNMSLDANVFYTSQEDSSTVTFTTNARVDIPFLLDPTFLRNRTASVSTMLYNIPEPQKLTTWIIPSSIVLGILLFCLLAFILFRVGFFNRLDVAKKAEAKKMELLVKSNEDEDDERYG